jgi:hypothetical protein
LSKINVRRFPYIVVFVAVKHPVIIFSAFHNKHDPEHRVRAHRSPFCAVLVDGP